MVAAKPKYPTILVHRCARSRPCGTPAGRYLAVEGLRQWLRGGIAFQVGDYGTGEDIARVLRA